jgi:hypothetical protein
MDLYIAAHVALQAKRELGLTRPLSLPTDTVMAQHTAEEWRKATILQTNDDGSYKVSWLLHPYVVATHRPILFAPLVCLAQVR